MTLTITIEMDNEAFGESGMDRAQEVFRVLNDLTGRLYPETFEDGADSYDRNGKLRDINGNTVGEWRVSE